VNENSIARPHWSFWLIAVAGLAFNFLGCINYVSQMNAENVAAMPEVYREIVAARPAWGTGAFAVAVFGGLLGCLLLLFRKSVAVYAFAVALVAAVVAQVPFLGMAGFPAAAWVGWSSQVVVSAFLVWYSGQAGSKGWIG
jgi:hypothetical protein